MACCIYRGVTKILMRQFDKQRIWDLFIDEQATSTLAVPAKLNMMLPTYDLALDESLQLRWIMTAGGPVPPSLIETYAGLGLEVHQAYGLTESCGPACVISPDDALSHIGSTGKAFFHTDVRIVDPQGAPLYVIRTLSDLAGSESHISYPEMAAMAAARSAVCVTALLRILAA